ncbi:glucose/ribitol dehydrogenase [Tanacetum coccineum]
MSIIKACLLLDWQVRLHLLQAELEGLESPLQGCLRRAKVIIVDILDELGQTVCEAIGLEMASYIHCDVCIELDMENAINFAEKKHGKLDIMINNAAITGQPKLNILENEKSVFERMMSVNVTGVFLGTKHAARVMLPACSGSIISIGSVSSTIVVLLITIYMDVRLSGENALENEDVYGFVVMEICFGGKKIQEEGWDGEMGERRSGRRRETRVLSINKTQENPGRAG